ncbi:MAG: toll/interleukin-1 receptor domain-containing protein [Bacteroidales bacterium]|nr:toll/interleukin-1 receptor domain-containing protein [Bacteroidales bacterium]
MFNEYKKKYAFISYSHKDEGIAKWLQRNLEAYRLPTGVNNECENTRYLRPVFRDRTDLNSGKLKEEIVRNLETSKFLIVLCSAHSADSFWVNEEIDTFINLGHVENIIPVLTDEGEYANLPKRLTEYYRDHPEDELLAIDLFSEGKSVSLIRIISRMLSLEFDVLWDRYKRTKRRKTAIAALVSTLTLSIAYWFGVPISMDVEIIEDEHNLPYPMDAILKVGEAEYPLEAIASTVHIASLPGYLRLRTIPICVDATYYCYDICQFRLGVGVTNKAEIRVRRDDSFGIFSGTVYDQSGNVLEAVEVNVNTIRTYTDELGRFKAELPLSLQEPTQHICLRKEGYRDYIREDECPGTNLGYILHAKQ